jgi:carboxylesterase
LTGLIALLLVGSAVLFVRTRATTRARETVDARITPGPDGIVAGASPIDLPADGRCGLLLLHGFGDTPQTLRYLADHMHAQGWGVRAPLLPGHGRTLDAFATSGADQWTDYAREELVKLRARYESVAIVGLSMGALATILAGDARGCARARRAVPACRPGFARWRIALLVCCSLLRGGGDCRFGPNEAARNLAYGS